MGRELFIRDADPEDAKKLVEIYSYYVPHRRPCNKQELTHVMKNYDNSGIYGFGAYRTTNGRRASCLKFYVEKCLRMKTENLGIYIESVTTINEDVSKVYMALTGDQVALTDIRLM